MTSLKLPIDDATLLSQRVAADPANAAWVSANAGSGKTYVLATRVIRLMLDKVKPDTILCLTYTKTAAAEMKNRVFERLSSWALMSDNRLRAELAALRNEKDTGDVSAEQVQFARTLFAKALETPGGLKIQTIHAFCDSVLHRFPLEANIAGHFEQLDDRMQSAFLAEARNHVLASPDEVIRAPLARLLIGLGDSTFDSVLADAVNDRASFEVYAQDGLNRNERLSGWRQRHKIAPDLTEQSLLSDFWDGTLIAQFDTFYAATLRSGGARALSFLEKIKAAKEERKLPTAVLNAQGAPYTPTWLFSKALVAAQPTILSWYDQLAAQAVETVNTTLFLRSLELGADLVVVVNAVLARYDALKRARGYLDFTDLIDRTRNLLSRQDVGPWVRYKLDAGIDHILVDEAQDTSPAQWDVIERLADDFFVGQGANPKERTIFAVGDEKQSIYSFQGADPKQFSARKEKFSCDSKAGDRTFEDIRLQASFRSTDDVLAAVDAVFAHDHHARGLTADNSHTKHRSLRASHPGHVELWEPIKTETVETPDDWLQPAPPGLKGYVALADRIAAQIKSWIDTGELLEGTGQPITPGDILILVRSRGRFVGAVSKALKDVGVAVAGADRLEMTDHAAVLDLIALGRFVLDESDSLSLAELLKSPFFGADDDDLFALVADGEKHETLFDRIKAHAETQPRIKTWLDTLTRWKSLAFAHTVFDFYATILSVEGGRAKLVGRLGPEAPDMIDEFLNEALAMQRAGVSSLQQFMRSFEAGSRTIKREMDQKSSQVRIMTVHGAKGLEAPVVFLVDPGTAPVTTQASKATYIQADQDDAPALLVAAGKADRPEAFATALDHAHDALRDEYRRLLYVGMTRAADRLIVTGYKGANRPDVSGTEVEEPDKRTWYDMVKLALVDSGLATPVVGLGFPAWRFQRSAGGPVQVEETKTEAVETFDLGDVSWMIAPAAKEPPAPRPLQPSGASVLAIEQTDAAKRPMGPEAPEPSRSLLARFETGQTDDDRHAAMARAARRGTAMHRLLQVLPDIEAAQRRALAQSYLTAYDSSWSADDIALMIDDIMAVLAHAHLKMDDGAQARAEVSVMGTVDIRGEPRAVSGVIDRIIVGSDTVHIIDYKTNLRPPSDFQAVPDIYIAQLALYRALIAPLYPDHTIYCSLIYTSGPTIIDMPEAVMDAALTGIAQT